MFLSFKYSFLYDKKLFPKVRKMFNFGLLVYILFLNICLFLLNVIPKYVSFDLNLFLFK